MSKVKAIKCPNCAGPLDLLGGGRVKSVVCSYCKSIIDLNQEYKVVGTFKYIKAQYDLPFEIGMQGVIKGVEWRIIGRVDYTTQEFPVDEWSDLLLFSPLYGYAWLTYENGHLVYSKRVRDFPLVKWRELLDYDNIDYNEKEYKYADDYYAKVTYVEGELTWIAKLDDVTSYIDFANPPYGISAEKSLNEVEYYLSEYLNEDEIYEAFGAKKEQNPEGDNPLKPFDKPFFKELSKIAYIFLFIIFVATIWLFIDGRGKNLKSFTVTNVKPVTVDFNVTSKKYLVDITLRGSSVASLNNFAIDIKKDNKEFFTLDKSYAYRYDSGKAIKSWDKSAYSVEAYINIDKPGEYSLKVTPINSKLNSMLNVTIEQEKVRFNYIWYFAIFTFFAWLLYKVMLFTHNINKGFSSENLFSDKLWGILVIIGFILLEIYT